MGEEGLVRDGQVVSMDYRLTVEGQLIDASEEGQPLLFLQGAGMIIPGLEKVLYGMSIGETRTVLVAPREGYGEKDPNAVNEVARSRFPAGMALDVGTDLQVRHQDGSIIPARIAAVGANTVQLDFNHPLAGKDLQFTVKIVALRPATPEEIEHRHVH